ncbi:MAG: DUF4395 domain-containing protein [Candidatus Woesearchaeota archaeon]
MKIFQFGQVIDGLKIYGRDAPYPVLNERDARAAAGIMLIIGIVTFVYALLLQNFVPLTIVVLAFTLEFAIRVLINPQLAPFYALGTFIVSNQKPEYSGAVQKRFAWSLGLAMALTMIIVFFGFGLRGIVPFTICSICLALLWLETSFGICVGCKLYNGLMALGIIPQPTHKPACPGGVCEIRPKK